MLLFVAAALAGPVFTEASDEIYLDSSGNWPRPFPTEGGWHFLHAAVGDYQYSFFTDDLERDPSNDRWLTGSTVLRDHSVALCPDGTYLHVGTAGLERDNDSLYAYRYDADFNLLASGVIVERAEEGELADVPAVCGETFVGAAWFVPQRNLPVRYQEITYDLRPGEVHDLYYSVAALGSSLLDDDGRLRIVGAPGKNGLTMVFDDYDAEFNQGELADVEFLPDGWTPYWAQAAQRVGDCFIVAHMAQDSDYTWTDQGGDLWLQAFDLEYRVVDQLQLSHNTAPVGGMQPGMGIKGDLLFVTYTKELQNYGWQVRIDLEACGAGGDDTGDTGDTGTPDDTGDPGDSGDSGDSGETGDDSGGGDDTGGDKADDGGCGCAGTGPTAPAGLALLMAAAALAARRR